MHDVSTPAGGGNKQAAVDNQDTNLVWLHTCLGKEVPAGSWSHKAGRQAGRQKSEEVQRETCGAVHQH